MHFIQYNLVTTQIHEMLKNNSSLWALSSALFCSRIRTQHLLRERNCASHQHTFNQSDALALLVDQLSHWVKTSIGWLPTWTWLFESGSSLVLE
jgi:hypothetical protein